MSTSTDTRHVFETFEGASGFTCTAMVLDEHGHGDQCGRSADDDTVHLLPTSGRCYLCGDPKDHGGLPHGDVTGDYLVRADVNPCPLGDFGCSLGEGHNGPHQLPEHAAPVDDDRWVDRQGDVWHFGADGLMHTRETRPFTREHVERKWGPLRPVEVPR